METARIIDTIIEQDREQNKEDQDTVDTMSSGYFREDSVEFTKSGNILLKAKNRIQHRKPYDTYISI